MVGTKDGSSCNKRGQMPYFLYLLVSASPNTEAKARSLTCMMIFEEKVEAQIQNLFAYVGGRKTYRIV